MAPALSSWIAFSSLLSSVYCLPSTERSKNAAQVLDLSAVSPGLPTPTASPAVIALGVGTQNYTCDSSTGTYSSNVALADLYDITSLVKTSTKDSLCKLYLKHSQECQSEDNPLKLKLIGDHFFDASSKPNFDFSRSNKGWLQAKKSAAVPAPANASKGVKEYSNGAVDWLYLIDNDAGVSKDLLSVYRVQTAGGKPPTSCSGDEQVEVPYAAEYWFHNEEF